ncbi:mannose-1-phosphate guanylyltransferase/mannose-6-phosphate isomerase [Methylibium petroleiphilum]|uniref:mannose-1-phosphate guanylyltransferase/mannose-6-phosphate isomerase n=1 Tax=Methylibium petroleiphilum TaxID=105560 RepID=UPI001AD4F671|nr:mannose-1-phosphate guanylyltransferase/mannose-6-phosphate isomerase [Methylibium petroleiphilum]MBN9205442.1 mannose-1-phosphate guanylyltransferase/mannose-6-phosphate isomerase [Methylibium petroleiphilum]
MSDAISVQPVVMAGGSGTRLWPLSRGQYPKQFLTLSGEHSLFQQALIRLRDLEAPGLSVRAPLVVGSDDHRFLMQDQVSAAQLSAPTLLLEPVGRNTAAALTLAALQAASDDADPVLVVSPADQTVADPAAFVAALRRAAAWAAEGAIVVIGVKPQRPETGFGYIRLDTSDDRSRVAEFVEKPDAPTAARYVESGDYFWNAGLFVVRASDWLRAIESFRPDIAAATKAAWIARRADGPFIRPDRALFEAIPSESVDYAVMEKCPKTKMDIRMVGLDAGWSDLGAWDAVWQQQGKDAAGNVVDGDAIIEDCRGTLVHATSRLVSVVGVDNLVVVETPDAILVTDRSRSQDVRKVVARLEGDSRTEHTLHRRVHRPWGWYDSVDAGPRFQVKRILVKPGATLSLQMHHHRAEHWIVVSGTAEVTCGESKRLLTENQSTYIPLGETHRLANPGSIPLEIIEVQSGSYLGEDDIVRFEDSYGRAK